MAKPSLLCLVLAAISTRSTTYADEQALLTLIERLNSDIIQLRNEVELQSRNRCDAILGCNHDSYDECLSEMSAGQSCPSFEQLGYSIEECGSGNRCNGLFDPTISTVLLPNITVEGPNRIPKNPDVIETVCFSRKIEPWMKNKYNEDKSFWETLGVPSPQMFFGSTTGMFRVFPGRTSKLCGGYDPRERPWYKGAVPQTISDEAPRNIVLLIDKSLSMGDLMSLNTNVTKLEYTKTVVISVLRDLTENDSVAVVTFDEVANVRQKNIPLSNVTNSMNYYWQPANDKNIEYLIDKVNALQPSRRSNWMEGFTAAFDLIDNSLLKDVNSTQGGCKVENVGLLFFSDGDMNLPPEITNLEVTKFVETRILASEAISDDIQIYPFLYSIANSDPLQAAKEISCATDGLWKPLTEEMGPENATNGYETLFSTPLGTEAYINITTWSNPYEFTSSGELGYTVSALVYDRSVHPSRYLGAVGTDVSLSAVMRVYNSTDEEETTKAVKRLTAYIAIQEFQFSCESREINLNYCEIQSLRHFSAGDVGICIPKQYQNEQGGVDTERLESYILSQNTTLEYSINNSTVTTTVGNNTAIETMDTPNEAVATNETNVTVVYKVQSLDELSTKTILEIINCSNAFVRSCPGKDEYPRDIWDNVNLKGLSYEAKTCCEVGTGLTTNQCPKMDAIQTYGFTDKEIFAFIIVPLVLIELCGCYFCFIRKRKQNDDENDEN